MHKKNRPLTGVVVGRVAQFALCVFVSFLPPLARNRLPDESRIRPNPGRDLDFPEYRIPSIQ